jgi:hypothetical protein
MEWLKAKKTSASETDERVFLNCGTEVTTRSTCSSIFT